MKRRNPDPLLLSDAQRGALEFLYAHLPQSDLDNYSPDLFLQFIDHTLALREAAPWCAVLDDEIFYHYVLFPRVNDEDLSFHREIFRAALWERIAPLPTLEEKVLEVNRWCCEMATYEMQDDRTASPLTVYRSGSGRCGEESVFAVSALRSVGIPARQVYSPRWAHCDDNHAWVEVLCGNEWKFFGACESEPILNRGWFNTPASRALLVHSRLFGEGAHPLHGEFIGQENCVRWFNQTARYALTRRYSLRVLLNGQCAAGAVIQVQVLNEASFHTIATLTANEQGTASVELGIGDFHVFAQLGNLCAEADCRGETQLTLSLAPPSYADTDWQEVDYTAPVDVPVNPSPLTALQKKERRITLAACASLRSERMASTAPGEIAAFLSIDGDPLRRKLMETLSEKDHRDVSESLLRSHFDHLPPRNAAISEEMYWKFVACPRIELEPLSAWREPLAEVLQKYAVQKPEDVFALLDRELTITEKNTYANLVTTPAEAWRMRSCSKRSARILAIAMLRTLGIPAQLREADGEPAFYHKGCWRVRNREITGTLIVRSEGAVYGQNWSISRREETGWKLLKHCTQELILPAGQYRVITSVRLPNGNQLAAWREVSIADGKQKEIDLLVRKYKVSDMLCSRRLAQMSVQTLSGETVEDLCRRMERAQLLLWCEEGGEPTEHILIELTQLQESFRGLPVDIVFLLRGRESLQNTTLSAAAQALSAHCLIAEDWEFDLEQTARHLTCDPDLPPLAVICDSHGNAVYGTSGYRVGAAQLLLQIAEHVTKEAN